MKTKYFVIYYFILFDAGLFAHDIPVHQAITVNAAESAYTNSAAYSNFLNTVSSDLPLSGLVSATNYLVIGSAREDDKLNQDSIGGNRSLNHFYDPIRKIGLSDRGWPLSTNLLGRDSFTWGSVSNGPGVDQGWPINKYGTSNIWSWPNARGYEWLGLTATNQSDRLANLENMFRAVGQVMHLLEDTSQPQHVRDEQHLDEVFKMDLRSRSAIEDYGFAHSNTLNYAHSMLDWRGDGFTQLKDFWDRNLLGGGRTALNADLSGGTSTLGLAEFTSGNFIGQRAVYAEFVPTNDIHYFAFPSLADTTQPNLQLGNLWGTATHGDVTLPNFHQGTRLYISKTNAGVQVTYHSALSYLVAQHPDKSPGLPILTIADDNVLSNYHNIFIPKAVQYSAGLLDYYFRGTIATSLTQDTNTLDYIFSVTNTSGQTFGGGNFYLINEDSSGIRTIVQTNHLTGTLASGGSTTIDYPGIVTNKFLVIYRGNIGTTSGTTNALDPVDAGIGIAATYAATCDCSSNPTSISDLVWNVAIGSAEPGYGSITATGSASGANGSFSVTGGGNSWPYIIVMGTKICNPTSSSITIKMDASITWASADEYYDFHIIGDDFTLFSAGSASGTSTPTVNITIPAMSTTPIDLYFFYYSFTPIDTYLGGSYSGTFTLSVVP